ncbi:hypothetical protein [Actinoplanes sichuanensis]|uniref:Uncharacterized protein n=1 Tax=Actinoplanes sichuanensis TaxID=512349 RepID=A0ABW4A4V2_9ACTN|nr:hypothetical protein [Actinoplanes sichuanensis]
MDDVSDLDDFGAGDVLASEGEQLAGQIGASAGGPQDLRGIAVYLTDPALPVGFVEVLGVGVGDEFGVVDDDGEQVVEVAGDPGGELAEVFDALRVL